MIATVAFALAAPTAQNAPIAVKRVKTFDQWRLVSISASTSSKVAFGLEDNSVKVFDAAKLQSIMTLVGHPQPVYALAFNKDGTRLLTADVTARIYLWDVKTGKKVKEFSRDRGHTKTVRAIAFAPNGTDFATVGDDDFLRIWNTGGAHPVASVPGAGANFYGVAFTPNGSVLTGTLTSEVRLYTRTGQFVAKMTAPGANGINGLSSNWNGNTVSASRDGRIVSWDVARRKRAGAYLGHTDWALNAAVSPNGLVGASSGSDGRVVLWQLKSGAKLATLENQSYAGSPITFTNDGKFFLSGNNAGFLEVYAVTPPQGVPVATRRRR